MLSHSEFVLTLSKVARERFLSHDLAILQVKLSQVAMKLELAIAHLSLLYQKFAQFVAKTYKKAAFIYKEILKPMFRLLKPILKLVLFKVLKPLMQCLKRRVEVYAEEDVKEQPKTEVEQRDEGVPKEDNQASDSQQK